MTKLNGLNPLIAVEYYKFRLSTSRVLHQDHQKAEMEATDVEMRKVIMMHSGFHQVQHHETGQSIKIYIQDETPEFKKIAVYHVGGG